MSMPIAIEVPRDKMLEISLFGLFKDETFAFVSSVVREMFVGDQYQQISKFDRGG